MSLQAPPLFSRLSILTVLVLSTSLLGACQASSSNVYGYDFSTARISYQVSGSSVGTSEMLISGEKAVIRNNIVQTKIDGTKSTINTYLILDGAKQYTLNPDSKTGTLTNSDLYAELQKLSPAERKVKMIQETLRTTDTPETQGKVPQPEQTQQFAGQTCDLYSSGITKRCLWEGIPLQTVASLPDYGIQTTTTATKIELNQPIADSEFAVPSDYKITELN